MADFFLPVCIERFWKPAVICAVCVEMNRRIPQKFAYRIIMLASLFLQGCVIPLHTMNPLHVAADRGDVKAVQALIESGHSLDARYGDHSIVLTYGEGSQVRGKTALHFAALNGHFEIVKLLVDAGADIYITESNSRGDDRGNAFEHGLSRGHAEIAKYIWDKADKTRLAPRLRSYHFVKACASACAIRYGTDAKSNLALAVAGFLSPLELGDGIGAIPCYETWTSSMPRLQFLLSTRISFPNNTLGCIAGSADFTKDGMAIAKLFLDQGADPNHLYAHQGAFGGSPLMLAAERANSELVALLLARGASPLLKNRYDETPLMYVMKGCSTRSDPQKEKRQINVVELLLSAGAETGVKDRHGNTAATTYPALTCCLEGVPSEERTTLCRLIKGE